MNIHGQESLNRERPGQATLESWKEIAAYLQRQVRTVRRWEKEEGLPVHRHAHKVRGSVYAYPSELDAWRVSRRVVPEPPPPAPLWRRILTPSFALTMLLCLVMVGNGIRPVSDRDVSVSPDGKQIAYEVSLGNGPTSFIAVMPAAGGPARELYRGPWEGVSRFNALVWTADQKYLLFPKDGAGANSPNVLWRVPVAGGPAEETGLSMRGLWDVQLHPDGRRIFFVSNDSGPNEVWALENFLPKAAAAR